MSAPVTERPKGAVRTAPRPGRTSAPAGKTSPPFLGGAIPAQRGVSRTKDDGAAQKAYARRDERLRRLLGGDRPARSGTPARRAQFVMLVMALLGTGLVLTLWLSTAAAADSYRLQDARLTAGTLTEQVESLRREVAVAGSAPELARRADEMGMVAVQDAARIVVAPDGTVAVVGDPVVAHVPPPPAPVTPPAPAAPPAAEQPAVPADGTVPAEGVPPADVPTDGPAEVAVDPAELAAADPAAAVDLATDDAVAAAADPDTDGATPAGN